MNRSRSLVATAAAVVTVLAVAGCGSRAGGSAVAPDDGSTLLITREFGVVEQSPSRVVPLSKGLTAMRQLQSVAKIQSGYGGRYVTSIDGQSQDLSDGLDWLFYVDGVEADVGAAAVRIRAGQVVQWDLHGWRAMQTGKAIVGAFPRPLNTLGVRLRCAPVELAACKTARSALRSAGVRLGGSDASGDATSSSGSASSGSAPSGGAQVIVGPAHEIAKIDGVPDIHSSATQNGVFARFGVRDGRRFMQVADGSGAATVTFGAGSGLIVAHRRGASLTWLVTGVDAAGVESAAKRLKVDELRGAFAIAVTGGRSMRLPLGRHDEQGRR